MNQEFKKYNELLRDPLYVIILNEYAEFKKTCHNHALNNTSGEVGEENIIAVHLYYGGWSERKDEESVRKKLEEILRKPSRHKKILFDSYINYSQRSHELVDEGVIDYVVFTHMGCGISLNASDLKPFANSKVNFIGGFYGNRCVRDTSIEIRRFAPYFSIMPIKDATVFHKPFIIKSIKKGHLNPKFYLEDKFFYLFRGVNSNELLGRTSQ